MTVTKYRDAQDMPPVPLPGAETLTARIRALWARAHLLSPHAPPRGLQRFRSIEEANAARAQATVQRMRGSSATRR